MGNYDTSPQDHYKAGRKEGNAEVEERLMPIVDAVRSMLAECLPALKKHKDTRNWWCELGHLISVLDEDLSLADHIEADKLLRGATAILRVDETFPISDKVKAALLQKANTNGFKDVIYTDKQLSFSEMWDSSKDAESLRHVQGFESEKEEMLKGIEMNLEEAIRLLEDSRDDAETALETLKDGLNILQDRDDGLEE